jgi:hypothetical protein
MGPSIYGSPRELSEVIRGENKQRPEDRERTWYATAYCTVRDNIRAGIRNLGKTSTDVTVKEYARLQISLRESFDADLPQNVVLVDCLGADNSFVEGKKKETKDLILMLEYTPKQMLVYVVSLTSSCHGVNGDSVALLKRVRQLDKKSVIVPTFVFTNFATLKEKWTSQEKTWKKWRKVKRDQSDKKINSFDDDLQDFFLNFLRALKPAGWHKKPFQLVCLDAHHALESEQAGDSDSDSGSGSGSDSDEAEKAERLEARQRSREDVGVFWRELLGSSEDVGSSLGFPQQMKSYFGAASEVWTTERLWPLDISKAFANAKSQHEAQDETLAKLGSERRQTFFEKHREQITAIKDALKKTRSGEESGVEKVAIWKEKLEKAQERKTKSEGKSWSEGKLDLQEIKKMSPKELKKHLKERGLSTQGQKKELIQRLMTSEMERGNVPKLAPKEKRRQRGKEKQERQQEWEDEERRDNNSGGDNARAKKESLLARKMSEPRQALPFNDSIDLFINCCVCNISGTATAIGNPPLADAAIAEAELILADLQEAVRCFYTPALEDILTELRASLGQAKKVFTPPCISFTDTDGDLTLIRLCPDRGLLQNYVDGELEIAVIGRLEDPITTGQRKKGIPLAAQLQTKVQIQQIAETQWTRVCG